MAQVANIEWQQKILGKDSEKKMSQIEGDVYVIITKYLIVPHSQ